MQCSCRLLGIEIEYLVTIYRRDQLNSYAGYLMTWKHSIPCVSCIMRTTFLYGHSHYILLYKFSFLMPLSVAKALISTEPCLHHMYVHSYWKNVTSYFHPEIWEVVFIIEHILLYPIPAFQELIELFPAVTHCTVMIIWIPSWGLSKTHSWVKAADIFLQEKNPVVFYLQTASWALNVSCYENTSPSSINY